MVRHIDTNYSELWKNLKWKQFRKVVFRLQKRVYKTVRVGDRAKARNLQKLLLRSYAARMLAIRQVTQLNAGKKTAGIDGKASLNHKERFELEQHLAKESMMWRHKGLREIPIPKKNGKTRVLKVPMVYSYCTSCNRSWGCSDNA
jgi:RNA-directed DNA polymerase